MASDNTTQKPLPVSDHLLNLCSFIAKISLDDIPVNVLEHAKRVLIDTIGVVIAGAGNKEVFRIASTLAPSSGSALRATCPGRPEAFDPIHAALINAMAGSTSEFEEGNAIAKGHPAIQMIPALLADSESKALSGRTLLKSLIAGYETASRVSRASSIRKGLHPTGSWGGIGAAIGVGALRKRDPEALCQIANIASAYTISSYVKNSFAGQNVSCTFAGLVNMTGLLSNLFFDSGIRSDPDCLEMTFSRFVSDKFDPDFLDDGLGEGYAITDNYFKPYPTCRFTQPALEALKAIIQNNQIDTGKISDIEVVSFKAAVHVGAGCPANIEALRFSIPYLFAVMLLKGDVNTDILTEDLVHLPEIAALAQKVKLIYSHEYEQLCPLKNPAKVTLKFSDGSRLAHEIMDCRGDASNPLTDEELYEKFVFLATPVVGNSNAQLFLEKMINIENQNDIRSIMGLLRTDKKMEGER